MANRTCEWPSCEKWASGPLCDMHRRRKSRGRPMDGPSSRRHWVEKFDDYANRGEGCWEWSGTRFAEPSNYGALWVHGALWKAHRLSYLLHFGDLPTDAIVCHHCDNPPCVNPDHLYAGTPMQNSRDRQDRGRGRPQVGSDNATAKLTEADVLRIRQLAATREIPQREIAEQYGVVQTLVSAIHRRKIWKHL